MHINDHHKISALTKFDPQDERIYCPSVSKSGVTGHGLLKKYYIPHLGLSICEYCEIEEDGEKRNLAYYQSKKLSKHLISELGNWREEILRFQNIKNDANIENIIYSLEENKKFIDSAKKSFVASGNEIDNIQALFQEKLFDYFKFVEEIMLIKDLIDECRFDSNGKLNLVGIGNDQFKEAKYIWMSLIFSNMKRQHLNPESFGLTLEVQKSILNFVDFYISLNNNASELVSHLCFKLLPDVARIENKEITLDSEEVIRRMPTTNPLNIGFDPSSVSKYAVKIAELERLNKEKDQIILGLRNDCDLVSDKREANSDLVKRLHLKIEELAALNSQKDSEILNFNEILNKINDDNNRNKIHIAELEALLQQERLGNQSKLDELKMIIENLNNDLFDTRISFESYLSTNKDLEEKILIDNTNNYRLQQLEGQYAQLVIIKDNLTNELANERYYRNSKHELEKECEKLLKALAYKDLQATEFNKKYTEMLNDYYLLKQTNDSMSRQLEGHIKNNSLLTDFNKNLTMRQTVIGSDVNIFQTTTKTLPIIEVPVSERISYSLIETIPLVAAGKPNKQGPPKISLYESQIHNSSNEMKASFPNSNAIFFGSSGLEQPQTITPKAANSENIFRRVPSVSNFESNKPTFNQVTNNAYKNSIDATNIKTTSINPVANNLNLSITSDKYVKVIDFFEVNQKDLLLNHSSIYKIGMWVNSVNSVYRFFKLRLLYKGSYENFSASQFKALCSNVPETIVVAKTNHGKLIGGYTPIEWSSENSNKETTDFAKKTFIFMLGEDKMFKNNLTSVAISNNENCGPVFGKGEIEIVDRCNLVETEVNLNFGNGYNTEGVTAEQFFGGKSYKIEEYEVYQIYENQK